MTQQMREALETVSQLAPPSALDTDAIWADARRANRNSRVLLVLAGLVIAVIASGLVWRGSDLVSVQPAQPVTGPPPSEEAELGFPTDLWTIPSNMPTTAAEGPIGPLALVSIAEHQGFWPWSDKQVMVYGVSAVTGEYRFLSLPGWSPTRELGFDEFVAMSPDGASLAYPHWNPELDSWPKYDGLTVYDTVTDEARVHTVDSPHGIDFSWMEWSPDSTQLMLGLLSNDDGNTPEYMTSRVMDAARYDVSSDSFEVIPDSEQLSSLSPTSWKPPSADANNGPVIPSGLVEHDGRVLRVFDPLTAAEIASMWLEGNAEYDEEIWNQDGTRFVATATSRCGPGCPGGKSLVVTGEVNSDRAEVTIEVIAKSGGLFRPLGWSARGAVEGVGGQNNSIWFSVRKNGTVHRPTQLDDAFTTYVAIAPDVLARGYAARTEPSPPFGLGQLVAALALAAFSLLGVFLVGRRAARRVEGGRSRWSGLRDHVWHRDAPLALGIIAGLLLWVASATAIQSGGLTDGQAGGCLVLLALVWLVWRRSNVARFLVFMIVGLFTALVVLGAGFRLGDGGLVAAVWVAGALAGSVCMALLLSPAVVSHVEGLDVIPEQEEPAEAAQST